jgi:hypothetical protein
VVVAAAVVMRRSLPLYTKTQKHRSGWIRAWERDLALRERLEGGNAIKAVAYKLTLGLSGDTFRRETEHAAWLVNKRRIGMNEKRGDLPGRNGWMLAGVWSNGPNNSGPCSLRKEGLNKHAFPLGMRGCMHACVRTTLVCVLALARLLRACVRVCTYACMAYVWPGNVSCTCRRICARVSACASIRTCEVSRRGDLPTATVV